MAQFLQYGPVEGRFESVNLDLVMYHCYDEKPPRLVFDFCGPSPNATRIPGTECYRQVFEGQHAKDIWKDLQKEAVIKVKPRVTKT